MGRIGSAELVLCEKLPRPLWERIEERGAKTRKCLILRPLCSGLPRHSVQAIAPLLGFVPRHDMFWRTVDRGEGLLTPSP